MASYIEFFSPAKVRCDPNPAISLRLHLLSFPKWDKRYKILIKRLEFMRFLPQKTTTRLFSLCCGCKKRGFKKENPGRDPRYIKGRCRTDGKKPSARAAP